MDWDSLILLLLAAGGIGLLVLAVTGLCIICKGAAQPKRHCDYILILGAKTKNDIPSECLRRRVGRGYDYLLRHPDAVAIVTGGIGEGETISEARCMFDALTAMGIDPQRIWMEEKATSTWQNLKYSLIHIEEKTGCRPASVGVVSSEYHLFRVGLHAKRQGLTITGIPSKTGNLADWLRNFLREIAGVWHFFILGGLYD